MMSIYKKQNGAVLFFMKADFCFPITLSGEAGCDLYMIDPGWSGKGGRD